MVDGMEREREMTTDFADCADFGRGRGLGMVDGYWGMVDG